MTKNQYLLSKLSQLRGQASNRAPGAQLSQVIDDVEAQVKARQTLGEDPDSSKLNALYGQLETAVTAFNQAVPVTIPSLETIGAGLAASDSE